MNQTCTIINNTFNYILMKRRIFSRFFTLLIPAAMAMSVLFSCSENDEPIPVPEDWITISDEPITATYEGGVFTREFTLSSAVNPEYVYIVSKVDWVLSSIENGNSVKVEFDKSYETEDRSGYITVIYDAEHQYDIPVMQEKAPPAKVSEIRIDVDFSVLPLGQSIDLNGKVTVLPENAGNKEVILSTSDETVAKIENGIFKSFKAGEVTIIATAADGGGAKCEKKVTIDSTIPFDRTGWTVSTSIVYGDGKNYAPDGSNGAPETLFDGSTSTYLAFNKPGKGSGDYKTPSDHVLHFVVDMGIQQTFNYMIWGHRSSNAYVRLRAWTIRFYGSNDGETFTVIQDEVVTEPVRTGSATVHTQTIDVPESTYRYLKCEITSFDTSSGNMVQISEFNLGKK